MYHLDVIQEHTRRRRCLLGSYCVGLAALMEMGRRRIEPEKEMRHLQLDPLHEVGSWLQKNWRYSERGGEMLNLNPLKKIRFLDHYALSLARCLTMFNCYQSTAFISHLKSLTAGCFSSLTAGLEAGEEKMKNTLGVLERPALC